MTRGKAEDAGGLMPAKDDNAAPYHFDRRTLPIFKCVDYNNHFAAERTKQQTCTALPDFFLKGNQSLTKRQILIPAYRPFRSATSSAYFSRLSSISPS